jgi:peptidyl-dipeptidase Dcp
MSFLRRSTSAALDPWYKNYAIHYQTKQAIPQELIDKIKRQIPSIRICVTSWLAATDISLA